MLTFENRAAYVAEVEKRGLHIAKKDDEEEFAVAFRAFGVGAFQDGADYAAVLCDTPDEFEERYELLKMVIESACEISAREEGPYCPVPREEGDEGPVVQFASSVQEPSASRDWLHRVRHTICRNFEISSLSAEQLTRALNNGGYRYTLAEVQAWVECDCAAVYVDENGNNAQAKYAFIYNDDANTGEYQNGAVYISVRDGKLYGEF